MGLKKEGTDPL